MQGLFEDALRLNEDGWLEFLAKGSGGDTVVAARVHQLLIADRCSEDFLDQGPIILDLTPEAGVSNTRLPLHQILCGRFKLTKYLGEGGMGEVYEAFDLELDLRIALKAIKPEIVELPGVLTRFKQEVLTARRINHANVCRTFDLECHIGAIPGYDTRETKITFLTMELLEGQTLAERIEHAGPFPTIEARQIALQLADAISAAHEADVVHCDLKPSNIFITGEGDNLRVVVTDFGIAKILHSDDRTSLFTTAPATARKLLLGTPAYMAPEQSERGLCTRRSDIYSFGLILFEALTGERLPPSRRCLQQIQIGLSKVISDEDFPWSVMLDKCLQDKPNNRFSTMQQVSEMLGSKQKAVLARMSHESKLSIESNQAQQLPNRAFNGSLWTVLALAICGVVGVSVSLRTHDGINDQSGNSSIAVLPFDFSSDEPGLGPLSRGMAAKLTNDLARFSGLMVPSQTSLAELGSHPNFETLRKRLHVANVVNGSITKTSQGNLVQVALIDAKTGVHRWGKSYLYDDNEINNLDEDLAIELASLIRRDIQVADVYPGYRSFRAQDMFRKGEALLGSNQGGASEAAAGLFQQLIDAEPNLAPAYERLAHCYLLMANRYIRPEASSDLRARAERLTFRSLELRESTAAYVDLAKIQVFRRFDWKQAEENADRAIELEPDNVEAHATFAFYVLLPQGRFAEARSQFSYADRGLPKSITDEYREALGDYFARNYTSSLDHAKALRLKYPSDSLLTEVIAEDYIGLKNCAAAIQLLNETISSSAEDQLAKEALLGVALAKSGRRYEAIQILKALVSEEKPAFGLNFHLAALCAALGNRTAALGYLKRAQEARETSVLFLGVDSLMDSLHGDSRFQRQLKEMNLNNFARPDGAI
ncbi:hypothetical protein BH10ACI4_BH10ACI4_11610 [soil metagenome]